jgi:Glycosyl hydrolase family 26
VVSRRPGGAGTRRSGFPGFRGAATMIGLASLTVALLAAQVRSFGADRPAASRPWPARASAPGRIEMGVTTLSLARNSYRSWRLSDLETVNAWEQLNRNHAGIVMWYADWASPPPSLSQLNAVARRGSVPEITWEPWRSFGVAKGRSGRPAQVKLQPRYRLRNIISGRFDPYLRSWAKRLAAYKRPVRLRFAQEMNGNWYPWSEGTNGNSAGEFARAWRHVHRVFRAAGARNVLWIWGPAAVRMTAGQYPGDAYVDAVGLTIFNGGAQQRFTRWRSFAGLLNGPLRQLRAIAPRKVIELSEVGCAEQGGNKATWITGMFATLRRHPEIRSLIWFDVVKGSDWRVASSRAATAAFAAGVADPRAR